MDRWIPYMERWEEEYGVPVHIQRAIILQESGGNPNVYVDEGYRDGTHIVSKGLWQVIDAWGRFSKNENPFDPDTNAREGLKFLTGCNMIITKRHFGQSEINWTNPDVLYDTFACYNAGPNRSTWPESSKRYARNILSLATGILRSDTARNNTPEASVSITTGQTDYNMCNIDPSKFCTTPLDWDTGWCDAQKKYNTGKVMPDMSVEECARSINNSIRDDHSFPTYGQR